jgi:hypothetical protein
MRGRLSGDDFVARQIRLRRTSDMAGKLVARDPPNPPSADKRHGGQARISHLVFRIAYLVFRISLFVDRQVTTNSHEYLGHKA